MDQAARDRMLIESCEVAYSWRHDASLALHNIYYDFACQGVIRRDDCHPPFFQYPQGGFPSQDDANMEDVDAGDADNAGDDDE